MRLLVLLLLVVLVLAGADARGRRKHPPPPPPPRPPPPHTPRPPPSTPPTHCRGRPSDQVCFGGKDEGFGGRDCDRNSNDHMWYYNGSSRTCIEMKYRGCGGNGNRYCSKQDCERKCRR